MPTTSSNCEHAHDVQDFTPQDVTERLEAAKEQSRIRGVRFTPLRQQIYTLVLQANKPVGAYDLITQLQQMRLLDNDSELEGT
ncbi:Fur family transcriptional regulator, partial [Psychrobacter sp. 16-Bac2893]